MIRLVIADDHAIVREGLKRIVSFEPDMQVVGEAGDGAEVMQQVRSDEFDVLVLDLSMPGRSGMELTRQVHADRPRLRILVLSMHQELQYAVRAIKSGACGYLTKDSAASIPWPRPRGSPWDRVAAPWGQCSSWQRCTSGWVNSRPTRVRARR